MFCWALFLCWACLFFKFSSATDVPAISLPLSVTADLIDIVSDGLVYEKLKFDCKINPEPDKKEQYRYRVEWFIDNYSVKNFTDKTIQELSDTYLSENEWAGKFRMGFNVKCKMRVKYEDGTEYGSESESEFFYAGFKVDPFEIYLKEIETKDIKISLTVPFGCVRKVNSAVTPCYLYIQAHQTCDQDFDLEPLTCKNIYCGLAFEHDSWNSVKILQITGKSDLVINEYVRVRYLRIKTLKIPDHEAWSFATIPDLKVHVIDGDQITSGSFCELNRYGLRTFDSRNFVPESEGEYVLYKHNKLPIQVNVWYISCKAHFQRCIFGIVIRHNNYHFIVLQTKGMFYLTRVNCDDVYMTITELSTNKFKVTLPMGTSISFSIARYIYVSDGKHWWFPFIHYIHISPSIFDWKYTSGLCGYFDGNQSNDLKLRNGTEITDEVSFSKDWRIPYGSSDSLFAANENQRQSGYHLRHYCRCAGYGAYNPFNAYFDAITPCKKRDEGSSKTCSELRKKRHTITHSINQQIEAEDNDIHDEYDLTNLKDYINIEDSNRIKFTTMTWHNGWNEDSARQRCIQYLDNNPMVAKCNEIVPNFDKNINASIQECMEDIKMSGGTAFLDRCLSALSNICLLEAGKFENLTKSKSTSSEKSASLLDDLFNLSCLTNCSDHGLCVKGQCVCIDDFHGSDCSLRRTDVPSINKNMHSGLCKTDKKSCQSYGIIVDNIIPGFVCKARHFKVIVQDAGTRVEVSESELVFYGTYVNDFSCKCRIANSPTKITENSENVAAHGYHISLSNDGVTYSEEITFVNYNSTCYDCNTKDIACTLIGTYDTCMSKAPWKPTKIRTDTTKASDRKNLD